MVRQRLNTLAFYRFRYTLAYLLFAASLAVTLIIAGFYLPGGLTETEMRSALVSDNLDPTRLFQLTPDQLIYLPYRLVQAGSISLFGMSLLGIKLPSIILGFASALGILYLLNQWYSRRVAIISATIAVTTGQFLIASQAGQAGVAYIFLTTMILIAASMIARRGAFAKLWVIVGFILAAISVYMPLNIYILVALALTAVIHPHARHIVVRQSSKPIIAIGLITFFVLISPLVIGVIHDVEVLKTLLGVAPDTGNFAKNASTLLQNYTQFHAPTSGSTLTPIYGLGLVLLIGLGIYRLISAKYTTKSYIISFWLVFLVPLMFFNPGIISITFIPVVLLIALAVDYLIINWYRLFPHNPYARAFGLLPLAVLMIGLIVSSVDRYVYGLHYDRAVYSTYSYDLPVLTDKLRTLENDQPVTLVVAPNKLEFYSSFARHQNIIDTLSVTSSTTEAKRAQLAIVERSMKSGFTKSPSEILVTRTSANADRFYLYKNS